MAQADVIVIGGGVIGASCARALASRGTSVMVLDDGPKPGAATPAAAGMLAPFAEAEPEDSFLGFCVRARDLYTELALELEEETGAGIGLWHEGILQVAMTESDVADLKDTVAWRRQSGFAVDWISVDELREIAPGIGPQALGAAFAPEVGALDPMALRWALLESARQRYGATFVQESVQQILFDGEQVGGVRTAEGVHEAGAVVIAAGSWSGQVRGVPGP
ncbi:MAG: FAD-dependent oxidoreductase, partial [Gemmatimonadota bacterium]